MMLNTYTLTQAGSSPDSVRNILGTNDWRLVVVECWQLAGDGFYHWLSEQGGIVRLPARLMLAFTGNTKTSLSPSLSRYFLNKREQQTFVNYVEDVWLKELLSETFDYI